jgi:hypothetical protein
MKISFCCEELRWGVIFNEIKIIYTEDTTSFIEKYRDGSTKCYENCPRCRSKITVGVRGNHEMD